MKTKHYRAAGGIVLDAKDRVLLLERDVKRDGRVMHEIRLPKGHVDKDETDEDAAVRETCEESGYCELEIIDDLGTARSEYEFKGKRFVRDEHYFLMRLRANLQRKPDVNPESEEALFVTSWARTIAEAAENLTYDSEREFARRAIEIVFGENDRQRNKKHIK